MSIEAEVFEQATKRARRKGFLFALLLIALGLITLVTLGGILEYDKKSPHIARIKIDGPIFDDFGLNRLIYKLVYLKRNHQRLDHRSLFSLYVGFFCRTRKTYLG